MQIRLQYIAQRNTMHVNMQQLAQTIRQAHTHAKLSHIADIMTKTETSRPGGLHGEVDIA